MNPKLTLALRISLKIRCFLSYKESQTGKVAKYVVISHNLSPSTNCMNVLEALETPSEP